MLTVERLLMSADERAQIEAAALPERGYPLGGCVSVFISLAGGIVVGILLTTPVLAILDWLHRLSGAGPKVLIACGAVVGVSAGLRSLLRERRLWSEQGSLRRTLYRKDLTDGYVTVLHCTVLNAVELLDVEEAPSYFLDVGGGQVLFLNGQHLNQSPGEAEDAEPAFPCTFFNMVQAPHSKLILEVECLGEPLTPSRTLDPEDKYLSGIYLPQDGEILSASLTTLVDDLKRLNATKNRDKP
jgi:hypothetical protein